MLIEELIAQLQEIAARRPGTKVYTVLWEEEIMEEIFSTIVQVNDTSEGAELIFT